MALISLCVRGVATFAAMLAVAGTARAQSYSTSEITIYGVTNVAVTSLNNAGAIVGSYQARQHTRGFMASSGTITEFGPIPVPPSGDAYPFPTNINDANDVLASVSTDSGFYGVTYANGRLATSFSFPNPTGVGSTFYDLVGLNRLGTLVMDVASLGTPAEPGISGVPGSVTSYVGEPSGLAAIPRPAGVAAGTSLSATAVNARGALAGLVYPAYNAHTATKVFTSRQARTSVFNVPGTATLGDSLKLTGAGSIAGVSVDASGQGTVFVGPPQHLHNITLSHAAYDLSVVGYNDAGLLAITFRDTREEGRQQYLSVLSPSGEYYLGQWDAIHDVFVAGLNARGNVAYSVSVNGDVHSYLATCTGC